MVGDEHEVGKWSDLSISLATGSSLLSIYYSLCHFRSHFHWIILPNQVAQVFVCTVLVNDLFLALGCFPFSTYLVLSLA